MDIANMALFSQPLRPPGHLISGNPTTHEVDSRAESLSTMTSWLSGRVASLVREAWDSIFLWIV